MHKYITLAVVFVLLSLPILAQKTISGLVLDSENREPLIGVTVVVENSNAGTITDVDGSYSIQITQEDSKITFSYLGYEELTLKVDQNDFSTIYLKSGFKLDEVIVTALGLERSSRDLGYAVQQIDGSTVNEVQATNFVDNLNGKIAGINITAGPTGVGSSSKITIRGEASFTNNNPLFVVDGTPINNSTVFNSTNEAAAGFQEVDFGNGAMDINPNDIESVSVLKGPSAAALYGTRASNGVILINTKKGKAQNGLGVSFNTTATIESAFQLPEFQNSFGQGNSGQFEFVDGLGGGVNDNITFSYGPALDAGLNIPQFDSPVTLPNGNIVRGGDIAVHGGAPITATPFVSNPDNVKNFYETGRTLINNLAFSGGSELGSYRLSLTDLSSESIIPGVNFDRKTAAANIIFTPTERLKVGTSFNYINSSSDNRPSNGYGSENIGYSLVAWLGRQSNLESLRDFWQPGLEGVQQYSFNYTFFDNPYFILLENRNSFSRDRVFGNVFAEYALTNQLSVKVRSGVDYSNELREFRRAFSSNRFQNGAYAEHNINYREVNTDFLINYRDKTSVFSYDISFGGNRLDQISASNQVQTVTLAQPGIFQLSNAASPLEVFQFESNKRINSLYGLAKFGFRDILYLDITGRNDWSSALATTTSTENTSFFYPSASLSLVLSKWIDMPKRISFAKLRASWAQVGNDTDPYKTNGVFIAQTPFSGQPTFSNQSSLPNVNLLPEQTSSVEFGADLRFLDDLIQLDVTYYNALTENQILSLPIAISSGFDTRILNGGSVRSEGIEAILGLRLFNSSKVKWNVGLNFSRNVSTVESLPEGADRITLGFSRVYDNENQTVWSQVREGDQVGTLFGTGYAKTETGEFLIAEDGSLVVDNDLIELGNANPDFILGINNSVGFKNFNLNIIATWNQGGILVSRTQALAGVAGQLAETEFRPEEGLIHEGVQNIGTEANPEFVQNTTPVPAETFYRQFYDRNHEENNTYDASYFKLREASLSYTFSDEILTGSFLRGFQDIRISLIGRNLFAISDIPHFDPEQFAVQGQSIVSGVEDISYASSRSFGLALNLNF
jgi:TonB-linked SusC/RagA family outer membrane protein